MHARVAPLYTVGARGVGFQRLGCVGIPVALLDQAQEAGRFSIFASHTLLRPPHTHTPPYRAIQGHEHAHRAGEGTPKAREGWRQRRGKRWITLDEILYLIWTRRLRDWVEANPERVNCLDGWGDEKYGDEAYLMMELLLGIRGGPKGERMTPELFREVLAFLMPYDMDVAARCV